MEDRRFILRDSLTCWLYSAPKVFCVPKAWAVRTVEMTSSARLPPSAKCFKERLMIFKNKEECIKVGRTCYSPHVGGCEFVRDGTRDGDTRKNRRHGKSQTPRTGVGKCITTSEGSQMVGHKCHFL